MTDSKQEDSKTGPAESEKDQKNSLSYGAGREYVPMHIHGIRVLVVHLRPGHCAGITPVSEWPMSSEEVTRACEGIISDYHARYDRDDVRWAIGKMGDGLSWRTIPETDEEWRDYHNAG